MKVYIGPYVNYVGPYQIAEWLKYVGVSEDYRYTIGKALDERTWLGAICQFIDKYRQRTERVKLHKYDTWNIDSTLAPIILPLLKQYRATSQGSPPTEDADVPEHLRSTAAPPRAVDEHADKFWEARWHWIVDEMIWAFEQLNNPEHDSQFFTHPDPPDDDYANIKLDSDGLAAHEERINRGLTLFGKYLRGLWD